MVENAAESRIDELNRLMIEARNQEPGSIAKVLRFEAALMAILDDIVWVEDENPDKETQ